MNAAPTLPGQSARVDDRFAGHLAVLRALRPVLPRLWLLLLPLAGLTALGAMKSASAAATVFCITAAVMLQFAWWMVGSALFSQNHPIAARLVPGHVRCLRETSLAIVGGLSLLSGLLIHFAFGAFLLPVMGAAVFMVAFAMTARWTNAWFVFWVLPWLGWPFVKESAVWRATLPVLREGFERQPLVVSALVLTALGWALWRMFQDGGVAHARSWESARQMRDIMRLQGGRAPRAPEGPISRAMVRTFSWGMPPWREFLLRRAQPTPDSVAARAELAALRSLHWIGQLSAASLVFAGMLLASVVMHRTMAPDVAMRVLQGAMTGASFGLMCALLGPAVGLGTVLHRSRQEQALLVLVPGMPRGAAMNRVLARRHMVQFLCLWGFGVGLLATVLALLPDMWMPQRPVIGLYFAAGALPFSLMLWRDWARQRAPGGGTIAAMVSGALLLTGAGFAASMTWGLTVWQVIAISAAATAALGVWRWRATQRAAPFWPVGRHAGD